MIQTNPAPSPAQLQAWQALWRLLLSSPQPQQPKETTGKQAGG